MIPVTEESGTDSGSGSTPEIVGSGTKVIVEGLLPYGSDHGDSIVPKNDDGYSEEISLGTDVVIFGFSYNHLYVSHVTDVT